MDGLDAISESSRLKDRRKVGFYALCSVVAAKSCPRQEKKQRSGETRRRQWCTSRSTATVSFIALIAISLLFYLCLYHPHGSVKIAISSHLPSVTEIPFFERCAQFLAVNVLIFRWKDVQEASSSVRERASRSRAQACGRIRPPMQEGALESTVRSKPHPKRR